MSEISMRTANAVVMSGGGSVEFVRNTKALPRNLTTLVSRSQKRALYVSKRPLVAFLERLALGVRQLEKMMISVDVRYRKHLRNT